jgi:hypothetical protein
MMRAGTTAIMSELATILGTTRKPGVESATWRDLPIASRTVSVGPVKPPPSGDTMT